MVKKAYEPWHRASIRHFSTRDILLCHFRHGNSRLTATTTVDVPGTKMQRISRYLFCGVCDRTLGVAPRTCDECGRPW